MAAAAGNADDAPSDDPFVVQSRSGTDWTVLYYPSIGMADSLSTPLNRTVNIVAVDHVEDALPTLRPYAQWLQTCGVALAPDRLFDVAQRVGETGIDRICPVGEMNRANPAGITTAASICLIWCMPSISNAIPICTVMVSIWMSNNHIQAIPRNTYTQKRKEFPCSSPILCR